MKKLYLFLVLAFILALSSCNSDFEVNDEWKAIPVVYCVLDQSQPVQYVKVTKAFLGDVPASVMAQQSDSLFYKHVRVKLYHTKIKPENFVTEFIETDEIPKDSGYFANNKNTIYKSEVNLDNDKSYFLEVSIDDIPTKVTNTVPVKLIEGCRISKPDEVMSFINFVNYNTNFTYEYFSGKNGKVFQMIVKFNYLEVEGTDTTDNAISLVWPQPVRVDSLLSNYNVEVKRTFSVMSFFSFLDANIPTKPGVKRLVKMPDSMEFHLVAADESYYTYMQVSEPSTGLAQSKPMFTNLENGIGIFASRYNTVRIKKIGERTLDSISYGIITKDKGFVKHTDQYYAPYFSNF